MSKLEFVTSVESFQMKEASTPTSFGGLILQTTTPLSEIHLNIFIFFLFNVINYFRSSKIFNVCDSIIVDKRRK